MTTTTLPRVLVTDDGMPVVAVDGLSTGVLIHDADLATLVDRAGAAAVPVAVDIDSIRGLKADEASLTFVVRALGAAIVITRRRALAERATEMGVVGLQSAQAFDSTGLRRSLPSGGTTVRAGTVVTPGLVVPHLRQEELDRLPRPVVAHGLIVRPADALACLARADAIVLRPDAARFLAASLAGRPASAPPVLTSIAIEE